MTVVTIRLDDDTFEELDKLRGDHSKADFFRDVIEEYIKFRERFSMDSFNEVLKENELIKVQLQDKQDLITVLNGRVQDLEKQLGWIQLEYQKLSNRLLLPEPSKRWWHFWKK
jgi:predicted CopG family antitoxin